MAEVGQSIPQESVIGRVLYGSKGVARPAGQKVWQGTCSAFY